VHPDVAAQMADGVRVALAVDGRPADAGIATTGVAGPEPQGGRPPGTVYVAVATPAGTRTSLVELRGDRAAVRAGAVEAAVALLGERLAEE
jgi:nicotinamide-nucleotide amidase